MTPEQQKEEIRTDKVMAELEAKRIKERNEYEDNTNNEDEDLEEDHVDHLPNVD